MTATDEWTVEVKASSFNFATLDKMLFDALNCGVIQPPEVIKENGDMRDWRTVVGTSPFMLADYVAGSSVTFDRNPNYWENDPRHPDLDLRLPYADEVKYIILPELATRVAALRTGKTAFSAAHYNPPPKEALRLQETNPELVFVPVAGVSINPGLLADRPPFDDKNVRIAMQKALNLEVIASTYYAGYADPTPWGVAPPGAKGYYIPYEDWPVEVKWIYEYDPDEAERLLDEAGYERGADGIRFKTNWDVWAFAQDVDLAQLAKSYWEEIGVDVNLNVITDKPVAVERLMSRTYEGMTISDARHKNSEPLPAIRGRYHSTRSWGNLIEGTTSTFGVNDPTFDALVDDAMAATDREEFKRLVIEADMYHVAQMWSLYVPPAFNRFVVHQPWLKGYRGELGAGESFRPILYMWVDQELKKEMGH